MTTDTIPQLTAKQAQVLDFIKANSGMFGPSVRQIAMEFGIKSPNGVACHLRALERKGFITRRPKVARGIEVVR